MSEKLVLKIAHLDDDPFEIERVKLQLKSDLFDTTFQLSSCQTVAALHDLTIKNKKTFDVFLLDINIAGDNLDGIEVARFMRKHSPNAVIIMSSNMDDGETIVKAINAGADDFISKACDDQELALRIVNSFRMAKLKRGSGKTDPCVTSAGEKIAGTTFRNICSRVPGIVDSAISAVFVGGESGTGKEVVADLFAEHLGSSVPFVRVNCGAIAQGILESELFGHVKGAFSGAVTDKKGYIEAANGGWIFLDEVATLTTSAQVALLRTLENQEVLRVGSTKPIPVRFRVISATNENISELIKAGKFRSDLWQRLRETEVSLTALRDRREEIPQLVAHFCSTMRGGPYQISAPTLEILVQYDWREGNVRELRNCLRAMTEFSVNKLLTPLTVPKRILQHADQSKDDQAGEENIQLKGTKNELRVPKPETTPFVFGDLEDLLLIEAIRILAEANQKPVSLRTLAKSVTISRSTLSQRLKGIVQRGLISSVELQSIVNVS